MTIRNLTPHDIIINGKIIQASGKIARCEEIVKKVDTINEIDIVEKGFGKVYDLPEPQENTIYVVSIVVAQATTDRQDVFCPGEFIRDSKNRIVGCKNLAKYTI